MAGLTTTALTLSSVAAYLVTPGLMARYGYRRCSRPAAALGAPALLLAAPSSSGPSPQPRRASLIMTACVVRGVGFAITCVAGYALTVSLLPRAARRGLALVGVVSGIPSVACLPLGVWLAAHVGYRPVFLAGGLAALAALASVPALPRSGRPAGPSAGILAALRTPALNLPAATFSATAMAVGSSSRSCRWRCATATASPRWLCWPSPRPPSADAAGGPYGTRTGPRPCWRPAAAGRGRDAHAEPDRRPGRGDRRGRGVRGRVRRHPEREPHADVHRRPSRYARSARCGTWPIRGMGLARPGSASWPPTPGIPRLRATAAVLPAALACTPGMARR